MGGRIRNNKTEDKNQPATNDCKTKEETNGNQDNSTSEIKESSQEVQMRTKQQSCQKANMSCKNPDNEIESEWEEDENSWLGCVYGGTHEEPTPVFWIQCDTCDAWYNCDPKCVGFKINKKPSNWENGNVPAANIP